MRWIGRDWTEAALKTYMMDEEVDVKTREARKGMLCGWCCRVKSKTQAVWDVMKAARVERYGTAEGRYSERPT